MLNDRLSNTSKGGKNENVTSSVVLVRTHFCPVRNVVSCGIVETVFDAFCSVCQILWSMFPRKLPAQGVSVCRSVSRLSTSSCHRLTAWSYPRVRLPFGWTASAIQSRRDRKKRQPRERLGLHPSVCVEANRRVRLVLGSIRVNRFAIAQRTRLTDSRYR
jgi:hypothetical protein